MRHLKAFDVLVIFVYMAALVAIGLRFSRRQNSTEQYFVARRSIPGWATGLSLLATLISSVTFIAYPGSAFAGDWSNLVPGLMTAVVLLVIASSMIPFYRHVVGMSAYEYFGKRFGYPARVYSSIAFALGHFSKMGFVFYLLALTVSGMTGWNTDHVIIFVGAITVTYTLVGGIEAVIWADVVQGFVLWLGIAICLAFLFFVPAAGPAAVWHAAWSSGKMSLGSWAPDFTKPTIPVLAIYGFFYYLQRYTADQTIVQRYLVAKSDPAALRGVAIGSLLCIPVWTLFMFIGTLAWAFYKVTGETLPARIGKADQVFPYFITTHIPAGLAGLFLAALFGAAMANLSSDFNSLAAIAVRDYYEVLHPGASERKRLFAGKAVVAVCGALCVAVASVLAHTNGTALSLWYTVSAVVAGGLVGLFLLAFLCPRAGSTAAYIGIGACLLFTTWATGPWGFPLYNYMIGVIGHAVLLGAGYAASFLFPNREKAGAELTLWGWLRARRAAA